MRYSELLEYRAVGDYRHAQNIEDQFPFYGASKTSGYLSPDAGFYFDYREGYLELASTENANYSHQVATDSWKDKDARDAAQKVRKANIPTDLWNNLSGKVDYASQTITIRKDSVDSGYRMKVITDIKEFQKCLVDLKRYGVTDDYKVKGINQPLNAKTVGEILQMSDHVDNVLTNFHPIMYHGTSKKRWDEFISKQGLRPGKYDDVYVDLIKGYSEFNVYLATDAKTAEFYGKRQAKKDDDSQYVVLKVTVPDAAKLMPDDHYGHNLNKDNLMTRIKASLRSLGSIAYKGTIMPKFITVVATRKA